MISRGGTETPPRFRVRGRRRSRERGKGASDEEHGTTPGTTIPGRHLGGRRPARASWTVLVYLDGDNDLEEAGVADVNQMEMAPASEAVNVLVQFDRSPNYDTSNGNWSGARRYKITHDTDPAVIGSTLLQDLGQVDMGSPSVLQDFVTWGTSNYPADHYALILWDHGGGWKASASALGPPPKGVCYDQTSGDELTPADLKNALGQARTALGRNLDVVACDACIMAALEVAYPLRLSADYYVASEEDVPNDGFDYNDLLARLAATPSLSARDFARGMVYSYRASYSGGSQGTSSVTLAAMDLSQMDQVASTLSAFADALTAMAAAHSSYGSDLHTFFELAEIACDPQQVDLSYFVDLVGEDAPDDALRAAAANLSGTLNDCLIADGIVGMDPTARRGVSIYYPFNASYNTEYSSLDLALDTRWEEFLGVSPGSGAYIGDRYEPDDLRQQAQPLALGEAPALALVSQARGRGYGLVHRRGRHRLLPRHREPRPPRQSAVEPAVERRDGAGDGGGCERSALDVPERGCLLCFRDAEHLEP